MITLSKAGAYLVNGTEVIEATNDAEAILKSKVGNDFVSQEEAAKNTMAYSILENYMLKLTTDFQFADWKDALVEYMKTL